MKIHLTSLVVTIIVLTCTSLPALAQPTRTTAQGSVLYIKDNAPGNDTVEIVSAFQDKGFTKSLGTGFYNTKTKSFLPTTLSKAQAVDLINGKPLQSIAGLVMMKTEKGQYYKQTSSSGVISFIFQLGQEVQIITVGLPSGPQVSYADNGPVYGPLTEAQTNCCYAANQWLQECMKYAANGAANDFGAPTPDDCVYNYQKSIEECKVSSRIATIHTNQAKNLQHNSK